MTRPPAIVDAHHHVWNPEVNYHPWLRDKKVAGFRYGDYGAINRRYLVGDYLNDARDWRVAGSVYVEAEWDPTDPVGEMDFVAGLRRDGGYPSVAVGQAWLDADATARSDARTARGLRFCPQRPSQAAHQRLGFGLVPPAA